MAIQWIGHASADGSVANLHGPDLPAIRRQHHAAHDVATAVTVAITIVVAVAGIVRIALIAVIVIVGAVAEPEADRCRGKRIAPAAPVIAAVPASTMPATAVPTAADRGRPETTAPAHGAESAAMKAATTV